MKSAMIYVVATKKRPAVVLEYLGKVPHHVCWTTDYKLPEGWKPEDKYGSLVLNQVGAYRCWRGHQDALKFFRDQTPDIDVALILEDDAVPNNPLWTQIVMAAFSRLEEFEVVSLHGRAFQHEAFIEKPLAGPELSGWTLKVPLEQGKVWVQGSLAYLIRRDAVDRYIDDSYVGNPSDIYIANKFKFAMVNPSPFNHDRKHGSLIDCATPKD